MPAFIPRQQMLLTFRFNYGIFWGMLNAMGNAIMEFCETNSFICMQLTKKYNSKDKKNDNQHTMEITLNMECIKVNKELEFGNVNLVNVHTILSVKCKSYVQYIYIDTNQFYGEFVEWNHWNEDENDIFYKRN